MQFFGRGFIALANGYVVPNSHLFAQNRILKIRILRLSINFVPHSTWELDEFIGVSIHLVKAFSKVVALLAGIIDVVNQGLVVLSSSSLLRTSVKIYF
jgi:hypothetical protein